MDGSADDVDREYLARLFGIVGTTALVTGARHGIGRTVAVALGRAGARVVVTARDVRTLEEVAAELGAIGADHHELELDVTDEEQVREAVSAAAQRWGRLDIVVNNAGLSVRKSALDHVVDDWDRVVDTNLRGAFLVSCAAARAMGERGGRIVNISSTYARVPVTGRVAYAVSKAGLEQLTRVLALEWAPLGITVNAVAPGLTPTVTRQDLVADPADREARERRIPLGRLGEVEDGVGAILLLVGRAGAFITGETILVDGGFTLGSPLRP